MTDQTGDLYLLALSILNSLVGICFTALNAERSRAEPDQAKVDQLKERFGTYYAQREALGQADEAALQKIVDELGPLVQSAAHHLDTTNFKT